MPNPQFPMIDPFTRTRFHSDLKLETWYPIGVLDNLMANFMVTYINFEEQVADQPFNRFADLSQLTAIHLTFVDLAAIAAERRASYHGGHPVKSAMLAPSRPAYALARMFAAFMEPSSIAVRIFHTADDAADWLDVPLEALRAEL